jgi:hypothetical protein
MSSFLSPPFLSLIPTPHYTASSLVCLSLSFGFYDNTQYDFLLLQKDMQTFALECFDIGVHTSPCDYIYNNQLHLLGTCIIDLRTNAAGVLVFVNTQLPYLAVQLFAVSASLHPPLPLHFLHTFLPLRPRIPRVHHYMLSVFICCFGTLIREYCFNTGHRLHLPCAAPCGDSTQNKYTYFLINFSFFWFMRAFSLLNPLDCMAATVPHPALLPTSFLFLSWFF